MSDFANRPWSDPNHDVMGDLAESFEYARREATDRIRGVDPSVLAAYLRAWKVALYAEPKGNHRPNGAYRDGWCDALAAVVDALRGTNGD